MEKIQFGIEIDNPHFEPHKLIESRLPLDPHGSRVQKDLDRTHALGLDPDTKLN